MQDVCSGGWHLNLKEFSIRRAVSHFESHLFSARGNLCSIQLESENRVKLFDFDLEVGEFKGGRNLVFLGLTLVIDLNLLNLVFPFSFAILAES